MGGSRKSWFFEDAHRKAEGHWQDVVLSIKKSKGWGDSRGSLSCRTLEESEVGTDLG